MELVKFESSLIALVTHELLKRFKRILIVPAAFYSGDYICKLVSTSVRRKNEVFTYQRFPKVSLS